MRHFLNVFRILWDFMPARAILIGLSILIIFCIIDTCCSSIKKWLDIKSPSKAMMRGWTREDVDSIIQQLNTQEWEATDYFDHIFETDTKPEFDYWLRNRKGVYDWYSLSEQEKWDLENEYNLL